jgi:hypothetical protein
MPATLLISAAVCAVVGSIHLARKRCFNEAFVLFLGTIIGTLTVAVVMFYTYCAAINLFI